MFRKFALVVFDNEDKIIDRYNLDVVSQPKGLGFKLNLSVIETDIESIITKVVQAKQNIPLRLTNLQGYQAGNLLANWIQKYSRADKTMALEYNDTTKIRYCVGKVVDLTKTELDEFSTLPQDLVFRPTDFFFSKRENLIKIAVSSIGKSYAFKYPYAYGKSLIENNTIDNPYINDIPLILRINGGVTNPNLQLLDENDVSYNRVEFSSLDLTADQHLIINSAQRKILYWNGSSYEDYAPEVNPSYDTFLWAKSGISTLSINLESTDTGEAIGSWRQYGL